MLPIPVGETSPSVMRRSGRAPQLVVIAASQGGVAALRALFARLPADFPVPIAVVLHRTHDRVDGMVKALARLSAMPVRIAREGEHPSAGTIYLAPADRHLVLRGDRSFHLMDGARISSRNPRPIRSSSPPRTASTAGSWRSCSRAAARTASRACRRSGGWVER
jgi:chemotaxis response regulator CheB